MSYPALNSVQFLIFLIDVIVQAICLQGQDTPEPSYRVYCTLLKIQSVAIKARVPYQHPHPASMQSSVLLSILLAAVVLATDIQPKQLVSIFNLNQKVIEIFYKKNIPRKKVKQKTSIPKIKNIF